MKKTVIRTALITLGITILMAIAVFGIVSFCAPSSMMNFTASIGLESLSGDYAYQEYERSGDMDCLVRSFVIAAEKENDRTANERFLVLYGEDGSAERAAFEEYCNGYSVDSSSAGNVEISMRSYILGLEACVKYRLAKTSDEKRTEACKTAIGWTDKSFPQGNPVVYLAIEAVENKDEKFCVMLRNEMSIAGFEENTDFNNILKLLEGDNA